MKTTLNEKRKCIFLFFREGEVAYIFYLKGYNYSTELRLLFKTQQKKKKKINKKSNFIICLIIKIKNVHRLCIQVNRNMITISWVSTILSKQNNRGRDEVG